MASYLKLNRTRSGVLLEVMFFIPHVTCILRTAQASLHLSPTGLFSFTALLRGPRAAITSCLLKPQSRDPAIGKHHLLIILPNRTIRLLGKQCSRGYPDSFLIVDGIVFSWNLAINKSATLKGLNTLREKQTKYCLGFKETEIKLLAGNVKKTSNS